MASRTYTARDVATALDMTLATFYRRRRKLELVDRMPKPLCSGGRHRYDRASFDAWLTRFHPNRPPAPANDPEAPLVPASDEDWRARLAAAYGRTT